LEKKIARAQAASNTTELADLQAQLSTQRAWLAQSDRPSR
jgi:hypothetical protein